MNIWRSKSGSNCTSRKYRYNTTTNTIISTITTATTATATTSIYSSSGSTSTSTSATTTTTTEERIAQAQGVPDDIVSFEQLFTAITANRDKAVQLVSEVTETKLADLPPNHSIMAALTQALVIAQTNAIKYPELLLKAAQYAVNCLFTQTHETQ